MGNVVEDLKAQISAARQELHHNLDEVEDRLKALVNWRQAYQSHAGSILTCAALTGFFVAHRLASKRRGNFHEPRT